MPGSAATAELDVEAQLEQALALCRSGRFAEAEPALRRVVERAPRHFDGLHSLGMVLSQQGRHAEALRHLDAALRIDARSADAHNSRGNVLAALRRFDEALRSFETAIALDPGSALAFGNRGNAYRELRQFAAAVDSYDAAIARDPADAEAYVSRGAALQELARFEEAVASYDAAIAIRPDYAEAWSDRGAALQELQRFGEAIESFDHALALQSDFPEALTNRGNALQAVGRSEEALRSYDRAIALKPNFAQAWNNRAAALQKLRRFDEALASYHKAIAIRPHYAEAHVDLGHMLVTLGRTEEGVVHFEQALAIDPNNVEAHIGLGYLIDLPGRARDAVEHCERALAIRPNDAKARNTLGAVLRTLGRLDAAVDAFEQAIALDRRQTAAYWNLVCSKRLAPTDAPFLAMQELERAAASLDVEEQIYLQFALGKALAEMKDPRSVDHLLRGNSLKRSQIRYEEASTLEWFARIATVFTPELLHRRRGSGAPSEVPVFIVGMPRSGSTLIEQILASHPQVFGAGERREIVRMAKLGEHDMRQFPEIVPTLSDAQLREFGASYVRLMREQAPTAARITDKMLLNFAYVGLIHLALPKARIIHSRRDPLDTGLSCFSHLFAGAVNHTYDLGELGRYYRAYETLMRHWREVLPQGIMLEVQYEEVVEDLEMQARRIVAHCGLEWDDACLAFHKTQRVVGTASHTQVRQPIYRSSVGRWREYEDMLRPFARALSGSQ